MLLKNWFRSALTLSSMTTSYWMGTRGFSSRVAENCASTACLCGVTYATQYIPCTSLFKSGSAQLASWWQQTGAHGGIFRGREVICIQQESSCLVKLMNVYINNGSVSHIHKGQMVRFIWGLLCFMCKYGWQSGPDRLVFLPIPTEI